MTHINKRETDEVLKTYRDEPYWPTLLRCCLKDCCGLVEAQLYSVVRETKIERRDEIAIIEGVQMYHIHFALLTK